MRFKQEAAVETEGGKDEAAFWCDGGRMFSRKPGKFEDGIRGSGEKIRTRHEVVPDGEPAVAFAEGGGTDVFTGSERNALGVLHAAHRRGGDHALSENGETAPYFWTEGVHCFAKCG